MKNPGAVGAAHSHIGMGSRVGEIEIDLAADEIVNHDVFARRTETQRALVFENVTGLLKFLEIALVNFGALALKIWSQISAHVRAFIPIQAKPLQSFADGGGSFLSVARFVGV